MGFAELAAARAGARTLRRGTNGLHAGPQNTGCRLPWPPGLSQGGSRMENQSVASTKQEEWRTFLFLAVVTAPVLAVMVVGGYGFLVWMYQLLTGQLPTG